jgi:spoIIIJ-associated protein
VEWEARAGEEDPRPEVAVEVGVNGEEPEAGPPAERGPARGEDSEVPAPLGEGGFAEDEGEPATAEEISEVAREFVAGLMEAMGLEAEVRTRIEEERALIEVGGEGLGVLIGRRGQTLDALQELTRTAVQRRLRTRIRLLVDVEGYRARRQASLADYARAMARRAQERGTEIELEPMNAYERKIVHDAIAEVDGASSYSEGEDPNRKVIVRAE